MVMSGCGRSVAGGRRCRDHPPAHTPPSPARRAVHRGV